MDSLLGFNRWTSPQSSSHFPQTPEYPSKHLLPLTCFFLGMSFGLNFSIFCCIWSLLLLKDWEYVFMLSSFLPWLLLPSLVNLGVRTLEIRGHNNRLEWYSFSKGLCSQLRAEETAWNYSFSHLAWISQFSLDTIDASYSLDAGLKAEHGSDGVGSEGELPV